MASPYKMHKGSMTRLDREFNAMEEKQSLAAAKKAIHAKHLEFLRPLRLQYRHLAIDATDTSTSPMLRIRTFNIERVVVETLVSDLMVDDPNLHANLQRLDRLCAEAQRKGLPTLPCDFQAAKQAAAKMGERAKFAAGFSRPRPNDSVPENRRIAVANQTAPLIANLKTTYPHLAIDSEVVGGGQVKLLIKRAVASETALRMCSPIVAIMLRDRTLHAVLGHLNSELAKATTDGFFWCRAHKRAEPIAEIHEFSRGCMEQWCVQTERDKCERVARS